MIDVLACVGLHWILRYGSILNTPRRIITKIGLIKQLFNCSLCLGFWCGIIIAVVFNHDPVTMAFASAAVCWFSDNLNNLIQRADLKLEND